VDLRPGDLADLLGVDGGGVAVVVAGVAVGVVAVRHSGGGGGGSGGGVLEGRWLGLVSCNSLSVASVACVVTFSCETVC